MNIINDRTINWSEIVSKPRSEFIGKNSNEEKEALLDLFITHTSEVVGSLSLLSKLCIILTNAPSQLTKKAADVFTKCLSIQNEKIKIKSDIALLNPDPSILEIHTPLTFACRYYNIEAISELIKTEDVNKPNRHNETPLMIAVYDSPEVVEALLRKGADPNAQDDKGWTALYVACSNGDLENVQKLWPKTDRTLTSNVGLTPLMVAAIWKYPAIVDFLLNNEVAPADPNAQDNKGWTALLFASKAGDLESVQKLWPKTNRTLTVNGGFTPLMAAANSKHPAIVDFLLNNEVAPADPNAQDNKGWTALLFASKAGDLESVQKLWPKTSRALTSNVGHTPLMFAAIWKHPAIVDFLLNNKVAQANPNAQHNNGWTALEFAIQAGDLESVQKIWPKTDRNLSAKKHNTPLMYAAYHKHPAIVKYLLENGAEATSKSETYTLRTACIAGSSEVVEILLKYGAEFSEVSVDDINKILPYFIDKVSDKSLKIVDKIKVILPFILHKDRSELKNISNISYRINLELSNELENTVKSLCLGLKNENDKETLRKEIDKSEQFLNKQLPIFMKFLSRLYGSCPEDIFNMRRLVTRELIEAKKRLNIFDVDPREKLRDQFKEKDIYQILFEWGIGGQPDTTEIESDNDEDFVSNLEHLRDEPYFIALGVVRKEILDAGFTCGADLKKIDIDNELEVLIDSKVSKDEICTLISNKVHQHSLASDRLKIVQQQLISCELSDSICKEIVAAERYFNIALLRSHLSGSNSDNPAKKKKLEN